jgi:hypothetical protein
MARGYVKGTLIHKLEDRLYKVRMSVFSDEETSLFKEVLPLVQNLIYTSLADDVIITNEMDHNLVRWMYVRFQTIPPTLIFDLALGEHMVDDGKNY